MKLIKKFWQYQKLMFSSVQIGNVDPLSSTGSNTGCLPILVAGLLFGFISHVFSGLNAVSMINLGIIIAYMVATSKRKLYYLVPVTKKFALFNLYILPLVISVISYFFLFGLVLLISFTIWGVVFIFKIPQNNVVDAIRYPIGIKTFLFCLIFILTAILVFTPISVIRRRRTRWAGLGLFVGVFSGLMLWLKSALSSMPSAVGTDSTTFIALGFENILPGFEEMPNAWTILLYMTIALALLIPFSLSFAYKEFMADISTKND